MHHEETIENKAAYTERSSSTGEGQRLPANNGSETSNAEGQSSPAEKVSEASKGEALRSQGIFAGDKADQVPESKLKYITWDQFQESYRGALDEKIKKWQEAFARGSKASNSKSKGAQTQEIKADKSFYNAVTGVAKKFYGGSLIEWTNKLDSNDNISQKNRALVRTLVLDIGADYQIEQSAFLDVVTQSGGEYDTLYYQNNIGACFESIINRANIIRSQDGEKPFTVEQRQVLKPAPTPSKEVLDAAANEFCSTVSGFAAIYKTINNLAVDHLQEAVDFQEAVDLQDCTASSSDDDSLDDQKDNHSVIDEPRGREEATPPASPNQSPKSKDDRGSSSLSPGRKKSLELKKWGNVIAPISVETRGADSFNYNGHPGVNIWLEHFFDPESVTLVRMDTAHIHTELEVELLVRAADAKSDAELKAILAQLFSLNETVTDYTSLSVNFCVETQRYVKSENYKESEIYRTCMDNSKSYGQKWHDIFHTKVMSVMYNEYFEPAKKLSTDAYDPNKPIFEGGQQLMSTKDAMQMGSSPREQEMLLKSFKKARDTDRNYVQKIIAFKKDVERIMRSLLESMFTKLPLSLFDDIQVQDPLEKMGCYAMLGAALEIDSIKDKILEEAGTGLKVDVIIRHLDEQFAEELKILQNKKSQQTPIEQFYLQFYEVCKEIAQAEEPELSTNHREQLAKQWSVLVQKDNSLNDKTPETSALAHDTTFGSALVNRMVTNAMKSVPSPRHSDTKKIFPRDESCDNLSDAGTRYHDKKHANLKLISSHINMFFNFLSQHNPGNSTSDNTSMYSKNRP